MIERLSEKTRRRQSGFTLIELLVVIIILGILAAVVVFSVSGVSNRGQDAANAITVRTLRTAEEAFHAQKGFYASEQELVDGGFITELSETHDVAVPPGAEPESYNVTCGENGQPLPSGCGEDGAIPVGGTIVVGETFASNATTNPAAGTGGGLHAWWETMYNGLLTLDEDGNPTPELVTTVPTIANGGIANGGREYTLNLRPGVTFHDGTTFEADDVKWTFEKILLRLHARTRNMAAPIGYDAVNCVANNITIVNSLTVKFTFTDPYAPFLQQMNVTEAPMNAMNAAAGTCPTQAAADAVKNGTGPFKFDSINAPQAGDGKVVRNPTYWRGGGVPYLDAIIMRPYTDTNPALRTAALQNGDVDYVWDVPNPDVAGFEANPAFETIATQSLGGGPNSVDTFIFNLKASGSTVASVANGTALDHPILGDVDVRSAIAQALNRDEYLNLGRNGIGNVSEAPISSKIFGHATDIPLPAFSPAAANALLDANGWNGPRQTVNGTPNTRTALGHPTLADGTALTIRFLQGSAIFTDRVAVMKSDLADVGIDMLVTVNTTNANTVVFTNRNFDLYILNYAAGFDPHIGVRRTYHSDQITTVGTPNNAAGYRNALVDAAFDNAVKTIDPVARFDLYHDFQEQVVADLPYVWMIETPNVRSFRSGCTGFRVWTGLFAEFGSCTAA